MNCTISFHHHFGTRDKGDSVRVVLELTVLDEWNFKFTRGKGFGPGTNLTGGMGGCPLKYSPHTAEPVSPLFWRLKGQDFGREAPLIRRRRRRFRKCYRFLGKFVFLNAIKVFSTKLSTWTLKCWFWTPGQKFQIFERPDTEMCPSEMVLKFNFSAFWHIDLVKFL